MGNLLQAETVRAVKSENKRQYKREVLVVLFLNTLICTLVAVVVWLLIPTVGQYGLFTSWVYSQCVGQTICISSLVYSYTLRKRRVDYGPVFFIGYIFIVPVGFFLGESMAAYMLSHPATTPEDGNVFWTSLLVTVLVSLFSVLFYGTWHHVTTLKLAAAQEAARASNAKLSMLQAQVEPHMLFNTLSNLRSLIDTDPSKAQHMLDHFVDYLRATLAGSQNELSSLKKEFELLENYLSLMKIRMGERLSFTLTLPDNVKELKVPGLILQPLVENAIKHGLESTLDGGRITVEARVADRFVAVEVVDTGAGYNAQNLVSSGGFGLQSVRERLQADNLDFDVLSISSPLPQHESGTAITVRFPLSGLSDLESSTP